MKIKFIKDGFVNILKGLGGDRDPRKNNLYIAPYKISYQDANNLYTYNWLAAKCIDIPVNDATRKWRELLIEDEEKKKRVEEVYKQLQIKQKINQAMKWARAFGGAGIIFVFDNQPLEEPLNIKTLRSGRLSNILVFDKYNLVTNTVDRDVLSTNFGKPETYLLARTGDMIHYTRVVPFQGYIPTFYAWEEENYWGLSYFNRGWDPIEESQQVSANINAMTYEANVDVYKMKGLNRAVAEKNNCLVIDRLKIAHEMKSIINGIALDSEDEYEKKQNQFANLHEIDDRFIQKVSGAWNIPLTKLVGISPAGMNATGESDMLNYDDMVQGIQENEIRPGLDRIDEIIMASEFGDYETFEYNFLPLKQLTEIEQADVDLKRAQRDQAYEGIGVVNRVDIIAELAQNGTYVSIDEERVQEEKKLFEEEQAEPDLNEFVIPVEGEEPVEPVEPNEVIEEEDGQI